MTKQQTKEYKTNNPTATLLRSGYINCSLLADKIGMSRPVMSRKVNEKNGLRLTESDIIKINAIIFDLFSQNT